LELFKVFPYPLLLLTKSSLILRDIDLLTALDAEHRVTVAVSLSTVDEKVPSSNPVPRLPPRGWKWFAERKKPDWERELCFFLLYP